MEDGDTILPLHGRRKADVNIIGCICCRVTSQAIVRSIKMAQSLVGAGNFRNGDMNIKIRYFLL
jgi:hypothetical protein